MPVPGSTRAGAGPLPRPAAPPRGAAKGVSVGASSAALRDRHDLARRRAGEELAWPADLVLGVGNHLVELRDPADRAGEREDRGEQAHRNADRALHDAGVEVNVRVELAGDEILVFQGDL